MADRMDYAGAVSFHESAKAYGSILGLDSIRALMRELGDIWKEIKIVHVAGTNGKGSVCCFLAAALTEAGYCIGQYNSPAVFGLREAYQISGQWISREEYAACMQEAKAACGRMVSCGMRHPTVFEIETALAFLWFYKSKCDLVLLETGMGGSRDATNLIQTPLCSVITSIGMDHTDILGNSLGQIAAVKAGIIKEGCPVAAAVQPDEAGRVLREIAKAKCAPYYAAPKITDIWMEQGNLCYRHPVLETVALSMLADYQAENSALAIEALFLLREAGFPVTDTQIRTGMRKAHWAGRFECICRNPLFFIDGAHNFEAAKQLCASLIRQYPDAGRIGIMGVMRDKPYRKMLHELLPLFEMIHTVTPKNPRSLPAAVLAEEIRRMGGHAMAHERVSLAVETAYAEAKKAGRGTMLAAFGSLYYLREVKCALYEINRNRQKSASDFAESGVWD